MKYNNKGIILEIAKRRASIRDYSSEDVSLDDILYAISCALEAPSGANRQPWRFIVIRDQKIKEKIRDVCEKAEKTFYDNLKDGWFKEWLLERRISWKKQFLTDAPYLVAVFSDIRAPFSKESTWIAIGYLLLALEERGLASLTYTPPNPNEIKDILEVPEGYRLETIIPVGKKANEKKKEPRLSIEDVVFYEKWSSPNGTS